MKHLVFALTALLLLQACTPPPDITTSSTKHNTSTGTHIEDTIHQDNTNLNGNTSSQQPITTGVVNKEADPIAQIREEVGYIVAHAEGFTVKEQELMGESTEGGEIKGFYENNHLRKILVVLYGEAGKRIYEYYYKNDTLIFAYDEIDQYNKTFWDLAPGEEPAISSKESQRFYFKDGNMIQWINEKGVTITDLTSEFVEWESFVKEVDQRWRGYLEQ